MGSKIYEKSIQKGIAKTMQKRRVPRWPTRLSESLRHRATRGRTQGEVCTFKQGNPPGPRTPWTHKSTFHAVHAFHASLHDASPRHVTPRLAMTPYHATRDQSDRSWLGFGSPFSIKNPPKAMKNRCHDALRLGFRFQSIVDVF